VSSRKALRAFWERHPDAEGPLTRWFKIMEQTVFRDFSHLRATFPSADYVDDLIVFNIGGNKYRLITAIHFNAERVYIRHVLTREQYDRGGWR
jgi:mRNA interferase HigB